MSWHLTGLLKGKSVASKLAREEVDSTKAEKFKKEMISLGKLVQETKRQNQTALILPDRLWGLAGNVESLVEGGAAPLTRGNSLHLHGIVRFGSVVDITATKELVRLVPISDIASRVLEKATKIPKPACHHSGDG